MLKTEKWFCPFCANALSSSASDSLCCEDGGCSFSERVTELFVTGRESQKQPELFTHGDQSEWFCPSCSHSLNFAEVDGVVVLGCTACGTVLPSKIQHHLLKRHSHVAKRTP